MDKIPVSVIVMTKNEEKNIAVCLAGLSCFSEVFVVDSGSTDGTKKMVGKYGAKVVDFAWDGKYPKKKQWCLQNLPFSHDYVLYVDADEEMTPTLANEIEKTLGEPNRKDGYFVGLDQVFLGRVLKHGHKVYKLILLGRHKASFPFRQDEFSASNMWEVEGHYQPLVEGKIGRLKTGMRHHDHHSLYAYFERHNRYSDWEAHRNQSGQSFSESTLGTRGLQKRFFQAMHRGRWLLAFLHSYLMKLGFLDGRAGFHYAMARAFYFWQIEAKTLELGQANINDKANSGSE